MHATEKHGCSSSITLRVLVLDHATRVLVLDHAAGAGLQQAQHSVDSLLSLIFASLSQVSYNT